MCGRNSRTTHIFGSISFIPNFFTRFSLMSNSLVFVRTRVAIPLFDNSTCKSVYSRLPNIEVLKVMKIKAYFIPLIKKDE